jgi:PAS domain S-box-containing protein
MEATLQDRLLILAEAAETLLASLETDELVPSLLDLSQRLIAADAYAVWRHFPGAGEWRVVAERSLSPGYVRRLSDAHGEPLPPRPVFTEDTEADPLFVTRIEAYRAEGIRALLCAPLRIRGVLGGTLLFYFREPRRFDPGDVQVANTLANLAAAALTNAELYAEERQQRHAAEVAQRRGQFLAEASVVLSSSLEYEVTLRHVAKLVVPHLADWCVVHVLDEAGQLQPVALAHADPEKVQWGEALQRRYPHDPNATRGLMAVLRGGEAVLRSRITDEMLAQSAQDEEHLALLRQIGFTGCILAPMRLRDRSVGVITFVSAESGLEYGDDELRIAEDLASRAASAIENARLYRQSQLAEARERDTANRLGLALEFSHQGDWSWDAASDLVTLSARAAEIFGIPPGPCCTWAELQELLHPDDRERARLEVERVVAENADYEIEYRVERPAGGERWVAALGRAVYDEDGGVRGMLGVTQDITARKQVEQVLGATRARLDSALAASRMMVWEWDLGTNEILRSENAAEILGGADTTVEGFLGLVHPEDRVLVEEAARRVRESGADFQLQFRIVREDGETRWLQDHGTLQRDAAGRPERVTGVCVDITEKKLAEVALKEKVEALAEADRRKDEFLAMLAHELRNPLAPIVNSVEILRHRLSPDSALERHRDTIERQARHLSRIVDDLLEVSRFSQGKLLLQEERVELGSVIEQAVASVRAQFPERGHVFIVSVPPQPIQLYADSTRLAQVLVNLLANAVKYSEVGSPIEISAGRDDGQVLVTVRDYGRGIEPELLTRMFDLFEQGERSLARSEGGLGLGLTLARRLVELHGGTLTARSDGPGTGSEFALRLPAERLLEEREVSVSAPPVRVARRILLVEDNQDAAETLAELLVLFGHEVRTAHDGPGALEVQREFQPEVILLDLGLPGMSGYDVASQLQEREVKSLLVALTGYGDAEHRRRVRDAGFHHHLTKPADLALLERILEEGIPGFVW